MKKKAYRIWFGSVADAKTLTKCLREEGAAVVGRPNVRYRDTDASPTIIISIAKSCDVEINGYSPFETGATIPNRDGDYRPADGNVVKRWIREEDVFFEKKQRQRRGWR